ncbi:hypothetical protein KP509_01G101100 [Ceratopteris richardii]|uniref:Phosphate transporter n=1 Tax=Ceratopteris richardii TaxID=49495 RepID=A0A8T2VFP5_CERRI|nr:hypothetical protein KP509_01G101100 [Ceratopteris richardii]KAH7447307.1 hypothetical protein KP509_01G101100 [Ceratopteris richardii]KAH7447308.1 hypothetical protein KP509_01G101100 [Ceratopteris richardii]
MLNFCTANTWRTSSPFGSSGGNILLIHIRSSRNMNIFFKPMELMCTKRYPLVVRCDGARDRALFRNNVYSSKHTAIFTMGQKAGLSFKSKNCGTFFIRAMTSSFADANGDSTENDVIKKDVKYYMDNISLVMEDSEGVNDGQGQENQGYSGGMAEAFNISSREAFGITAVVVSAGLLLPLFMNPVTVAQSFRIKTLSYATLLCGFYMAWNIGANDVANAMGTSVGSGALTLRQAVLIAAFLEFSGAFLVGAHVSHTMQKGILMTDFFKGKGTLLFSGMLSSLAAAGTWLQVASFYGWPVSTTHCIVGAMVGFGLIYGGPGAVFWTSLARVVSSWFISPFLGAAMSFTVYKFIRMFVYSAPNPGQAAATVAPLAVFIGVVAFSLTAFPMSENPLILVVKVLAFGLVCGYLVHIMVQKQFGSLLGDYCEVPLTDERVGKGLLRFLSYVGGPVGTQLRVVYGVFGYLQVLSACFMSFAHGANDVANAIGPISAALAILQGGGLNGGEIAIPTDILAWGGFGIVAGLLVWGYRVIATIGKKITELTPTRGFAAEFAAATVVVIASRLGLPISATHTLVGAVMGVGLARGLNSVRRDTVREIVTSWVITIPVGALLSVIYTFLLTKFLIYG